MRVACLMMQKDEDLLIEPWIVYHGYQFGFENLIIFDNGSSDARVQSIIRKYEGVGVIVDRSRNTIRDFDNKGVIIGQRIKELQDKGHYDFFFPLDCDEFVALSGERGFSCERNEIHSYLESSCGIEAILEVKHSLANVPGYTDLFGLIDLRKSIVPSHGLSDIDHGFHQARLSNGSAPAKTRIVYIHMHYKPYMSLIRHARDKLRPFVDPDNLESLKSFNGVGKHLTRYFFQTPDEYYNLLKGVPIIRLSSFERLLSVLMCFDPVKHAWCARDRFAEEGLPVLNLDDFGAEAYGEANPDVVLDGIDLLIHYCIFGIREKRPLRKMPEHNKLLVDGGPGGIT